MACYRSGGCGPYEMLSCGECPASKKLYLKRYKPVIGITEAGDAGIDLSWTNEVSNIDSAVLITKHITPEFIKAVMKFKGKVIVHATVTGFGGSWIEPNVPTLDEEVENVLKLLEAGFDKDFVVIRIDPIIPNEKGLVVAGKVFTKFMRLGFNRYRVSVLDMYPYVRERFRKAGKELPYGNDYQPSKEGFKLANLFIVEAKRHWLFHGHGDDSDLRIESCAEPELNSTIQCGCISEYDLKLLGFNDVDDSYPGYQRLNCKCYSGKKELLNKKQQCANACAYCYWR